MQEDHRRTHSHVHSLVNGTIDHRRRLMLVFALTFGYMLAEAIGGFFANSLALLSDAGHMLTDVAALVMALLAISFASRPVTPEKTYGYYRMEILAALANGAGLVVISLLISYEAVRRIKHPESVRSAEVIVIAIGGLVINAISAWLLRSSSHQNLNMRGAFLHVLGDALGSVGAIVAGVLIRVKGWIIADPIISVLVCLLIIYTSWQLIRASVNILLEGTPSHISVRDVIEAMQAVEGVSEVHDLHIWTISSGKEALSAHVMIEPGVSHRATLDALQERLRSGFDIGHVTIQVEAIDETDRNGKLYQLLRRN